jgi:hypothetical protein
MKAAVQKAHRLALLLAFLVALAPTAAGAADTLVRQVRISLRVTGNGTDARIELPLPRSDEHQTVLAEKLSPRGFQVEEVERDGNRLAILTYPKFRGTKRIAYEALVETRTTAGPPPSAPPRDAADAPREDRRWLRPTKNLQSSSPLVREKLIEFATPRLAAGEHDAVAIAWELTASGFERKPDGSRTVLKAIRTGHARDRGLDRLLATFLRTSGIPARPVGGLDLTKKSGSRLTGWVEAKTDGDWAPLSVPRNLMGELPARYLKLWHGDRPFLVREGIEKLAFRIKVQKPAKEAQR